MGDRPLPRLRGCAVFRAFACHIAGDSAVSPDNFGTAGIGH